MNKFKELNKNIQFNNFESIASFFDTYLTVKVASKDHVDFPLVTPKEPNYYGGYFDNE
jgi:hypothetical protein